MGFFDRFKKKKEEPAQIDPLHDLRLDKMKVGYLVDYNTKTWEVVGYNLYEFGPRDEAEEWSLRADGALCFLERYEDDEVEWSFCKKIRIASIDENVSKHIQQFDEPPRKITYQGTQYTLDEEDGGRYLEGGRPPGQEFLAWTFIDDEEEQFVTIEQWGENDFEAAAGFYVEEYEFTNILPGVG